MAQEMKARPSYAISSVDHALHIARMLQLEGRLTVSEAALRLGIARSTAHRLLTMLVYRDFAVQDESRVYHAGPVLELAAHSPSEASRLRTIALPHLHHVVDVLDESANLIARTGDTARFIASVECGQSLRVGNREGMVFPAHRSPADWCSSPSSPTSSSRRCTPRSDSPSAPASAPTSPSSATTSRTSGARDSRSTKGAPSAGSSPSVARYGAPTGPAAAGISISMPSVRYDPHRLRSYVATLGLAARGDRGRAARDGVSYLAPVVNGSTSRDGCAASR